MRRCYCIPSNESHVNEIYPSYDFSCQNPYIQDIFGQHNTYLTVKNDTSDPYTVYWIGVGIAPQCVAGLVPPFAFVCDHALLQPGQSQEGKMAGYGNSVGLMNQRTGTVYGYKQSFDKQNEKVTRIVSQIVKNSYDLTAILGPLASTTCYVAKWFSMIPGMGWVLDKVGIADACNL